MERVKNALVRYFQGPITIVQVKIFGCFVTLVLSELFSCNFNQRMRFIWALTEGFLNLANPSFIYDHHFTIQGCSRLKRLQNAVFLAGLYHYFKISGMGFQLSIKSNSRGFWNYFQDNFIVSNFIIRLFPFQYIRSLHVKLYYILSLIFLRFYSENKNQFLTIELCFSFDSKSLMFNI